MKLEIKNVNIMKSSEYHRFYLGILMQNPSYIFEVYNKQIGVIYDKQTKTLMSPLENAYNWYTDTCLDIEGIILGKTWRLLGDDMPNNLPKLIRDKLDDRFYVKYTGDVFYIKNKLEYDLKHFWTDIYIIGYDEDNFIAIGKTRNSWFEEYIISSEEIVESVIKRNNTTIYNEYTYSFELDFYKLKKNLQLNIDYKIMKERLYDYLNSVEKERYFCGIDCYFALISEWLKVGVIKEQLLFIYDHIRLMNQRLVFINNFIKMPSFIIDDYNNLEINMEKLVDLSEKNQKETVSSLLTIIENEKKILSYVLLIMGDGF